MKFYNKNIYYILILFIIISLSNLRIEPIFGKFKFINLNTFRANYPAAHSLDDLYFKINNQSSILSDPVTQQTFFGLFGMKSLDYFRSTYAYPNLLVPIVNLLNHNSSKNNTICLINLKGFTDTWVPYVTHHWDPIISNTSRFYEYNGYHGKKLNIILHNQFPGKCIVIADKEVPWKEGENFRYLSPNLNYTTQQEDVHILQFRKGDFSAKYNILIDVGMSQQTGEKLLDYLAMNEIFKIDEIFITHPHKDHYSGLYDLINFSMPIGKIWMNMPDKKKCDSEIPWGCDYADLVKLQTLMKAKKIPFAELHHIRPDNPKVVYSDNTNELLVLYASPPFNKDLGMMDINDLSMILKLKTNGIEYLFTGDLNKPLSEYLKGNSAFKANILKIPHHGTEGVAADGFFDTVSGEIGIVPAPQHLWCSSRSDRIRNYFKKMKTKMYISGFHGDLMIRHFVNGGYTIKSELSPGSICEK